VIQALVVYCVITSNDKHTLDSFASPLLAERHLQNSMIDWFSRYLSTKVIQFTARYFEIGSGVFVLQWIQISFTLREFTKRNNAHE
jgi:hypothetical protein